MWKHISENSINLRSVWWKINWSGCNEHTVWCLKGIISLLDNVNPKYMAIIQLILGVFTQQSKYRHRMLNALSIECHLMNSTLNQSLCGMDIQSFLFHAFRALMLKGVIHNCLLVSPWWPELQYKQSYSTHHLKWFQNNLPAA